MVTMKDIALRTSVSIATVSNVLNGKPGAASPAKSAEILSVAEELRYQPNFLAKNLKLQANTSIGIITEDLTVFNAPEIVNGIEEYCEEHGFEIILANMRLYKRYDNDFTDTPQHAALFENALNNLRGKQVAGIVYVGYHSRQVSYRPHSNIPFVYAYCRPQELDKFSYVMTDDERAGYDVGCGLLARGHRRIGVISGPIANQTALNRLRGYQRALYENGVLYNAGATTYGDWSRESGYRCSETLLNLGLTAIFAFNDEMASGVYGRCVERGLRVGKDLSVFGFDNLSLIDAFHPSISSVAPPLNAIGRKSAELVISQIRSHTVKRQGVLLPATVYMRDSVADLRENAHGAPQTQS